MTLINSKMVKNKCKKRYRKRCKKRAKSQVNQTIGTRKISYYSLDNWVVSITYEAACCNARIHAAKELFTRVVSVMMR